MYTCAICDRMLNGDDVEVYEVNIFSDEMSTVCERCYEDTTELHPVNEDE